MAKNIIICSDGTGNSGGKTRDTNIWRIFNAVDRNVPDCKQITYYDDGVGTSSLKLLRLLGGAFGWGFSRNVRQAYEFLAKNYEAGDKVFLFRFSRGAFTVRSLAGVVGHCGLVKRNRLIGKSYRQRKKLLKKIISRYRDTRNEPCVRYQKVDIHFIGVWDTVDAVGAPFDGLKRFIGFVTRHLLQKRLWKFRDQKLGKHVHNAYHALSLDDERKTFHPLVWEHDNSPPSKECSPSNGEQQHIEQVWFAGVHSNVGGSYPKDSMSLVSLDWMMGAAEKCELKFIAGQHADYRKNADVHGKMYDSRTGLGMFYRPTLRKIEQGVIHHSVFERIKRCTDNYAPKIIREEIPLHNQRDDKSLPSPLFPGLPEKVVDKLFESGIRRKRLYVLSIVLLLPLFYILEPASIFEALTYGSFSKLLNNLFAYYSCCIASILEICEWRICGCESIYATLAYLFSCIIPTFLTVAVLSLYGTLRWIKGRENDSALRAWQRVMENVQESKEEEPPHEPGGRHSRSDEDNVQKSKEEESPREPGGWRSRSDEDNVQESKEEESPREPGGRHSRSDEDNVQESKEESPHV